MFRNSLNDEKIEEDFPKDKFKFNYLKSWMTKYSQDGYEKYTYYWIAFNIYYNLSFFKDFPENSIFTSSEIKRVEYMQEKMGLDVEESSKNFIEKLEREVPDYWTLLNKFSLVKKKRNGDEEDLNQSFKDAKNDNNYKLAFEKLLDILYVIRCNLFHGHKKPSDADQNKLLEDSARVLWIILSNLLEPYFLDK